MTEEEYQEAQTLRRKAREALEILDLFRTHIEPLNISVNNEYRVCCDGKNCDDIVLSPELSAQIKPLIKEELTNNFERAQKEFEEFKA